MLVRAEERETLSAPRMAARLNLKRRQMFVLIARGCPHETSSNRTRFDVRETLAWWADNEVRLLTKSRRIREVCDRDADAAAFAGIIYAVIDTRDGSTLYVGKATHLTERWRQHVQKLARGAHGNWRLQAWFDETGRDRSRLDLQIVEMCSAAEINHRERHWVEQERKTGKLLNISDGGEGLNRTHEPEVRRKLSEISKAKWADPVYRARWEQATGHDRQAIADRKGAETAGRAAKAAKRAQAAVPTIRVPLTIRSDYTFLHLKCGVRVVIDRCDWDRLSRHGWHKVRKNQGWRIKRGSGVLLTRDAAQAVAGQEVRLNNGNPLDCRRRNLSVGKGRDLPAC